MVFMDVLLQKWPNHGQELLKYMHTIRLASSRGSGLGWVSYDEQYRLRKARSPQSSWASIDMELWFYTFPHLLEVLVSIAEYKIS